ncbi:MAG TPA: EF-hand domain-containing protein [Verrucomicrobiae bacterium]
MKTNMKIMLGLAAMLALGTTALVAQPQGNGGPQNGNGPGGQPMRGQRPPPPLIVGVLDANHDGVIDAQEIANASAALKSLDRNGDGKLTPDEFMGPRPPRPGGPGRGPAGNPGADDNNLPPGPPPGGGDGNMPPGPPPGQQ